MLQQIGPDNTVGVQTHVIQHRTSGSHVEYLTKLLKSIYSPMDEMGKDSRIPENKASCQYLVLKAGPSINPKNVHPYFSIVPYVEPLPIVQVIIML